jgi:site-specific recombinase XerD
MSDNVAAGMVAAAVREVARRRALEEAARGYAAASKAPNTLRAYRSDLRDFEGWCRDQGAVSMPAAPATVVLYITALAEAGAKASTIQRRISALSQAHQLAGHVPPPTADPRVRTTMAGIRRTLGTAPSQKAAVITDELRRLLATAPPDTHAGRRDRALLLLGFAGGLRRSELVALDAQAVTETDDGLRLFLRRSKTDQEGQGDEIGIPFGQHPDTCPIRALRAWRSAAGIATGPLFRAVTRHDQVAAERLTDGSVARIVQRAARRAGLDPTRYAGHSLRAGLATTAAAGGASERAIMRQGRWKSVTTARKYIRTGTLFEENAAAYCGL